MRGIGARGGSGKGRKRLIIGIIIVVLIIIGVACGGKGGDTSDSDSKPSRNGFDASTNKEIEVAGMIFSVPKYCDFEENEDGDLEAMLEGDHGMIMIQNTDTTFTEDEFYSNKEHYIKEWNEKIECETLDDGTFTTSNDEGTKMTGKSDMVLNSDNNKLIIFVLYQSENAEYDYISDFDAIVASGHKASETADTDDSESSSSSNSGDRPETDISPEFKKTMDSYEEFFDEYVDFMKNYDENTSDPAMLMKMSELMTKEADMLQKMESMDQSEMTTAEAAYYLEVTARIEAKLATVQ